MFNAGHLIGKVTQLGFFRFRDRAAVVSRDPLHQQMSLNLCDICNHLKVTLHLEPMPSIHENHGGCFIEEQNEYTMEHLHTLWNGFPSRLL